MAKRSGDTAGGDTDFTDEHGLKSIAAKREREALTQRRKDAEIRGAKRGEFLQKPTKVTKAWGIINKSQLKQRKLIESGKRKHLRFLRFLLFKLLYRHL